MTNETASGKQDNELSESNSQAWRLQLIDPSESVRLAGHALELAVQSHDELGAARAAITIAVFRVRQGEFAEAEEEIRRLEVVFRRHNDKRGLLRVRFGQYIIKDRRGDDWHATYEELRAFMPEVNSVGDTLDQILFENLLGTFALHQGHLDVSLQCYFKALSLARQSGYFDCQALVLSNIGDAQHDCGNDETALDYLEQAHTLTVQHGIKSLICFTASNLAMSQMALDRIGQARATIDSVFKTSVDGTLPASLSARLEISFLAMAAEVYAVSGDLATAESLIAKADSRADNFSDVSLQVDLRRVAGEIEFRKGSIEPALIAYEQALRILESRTPITPQEALLIHGGLAKAHAARGDWQSAYGFLERRNDAYESLQSSAARARVITTQIYAELVQAERERDAAKLRQAEAERELAYIDPLTKLSNYEKITIDGDSWLQRGNRVLVLVLRISRFNTISQTLGHENGDTILVETAKRLAVIPDALVAHFYTNRFCLAIRDPDRYEALREAIERGFSSPLLIAAQPVDVVLSVGAAWSPEHGTVMTQLLRNAEISLHAIHHNHSDWKTYSPEMETNKRGDLDLLSSLKHAIEFDELRLFLQPKIRVSDGKATSAEALVRWIHPTRGMVSPNDFIPFAETTGSICLVTDWMLREAIRFLHGWPESRPPIQVSVNISTHDLRDRGFVAKVKSIIAETGADPGSIRLEITESGVMENPDLTLVILNELKQAGFSLSIDDFGTGYSSLAYLQKMPVAELKIDRSFVSGVIGFGDGEMLLDSIITMGHRLGLSVVAEGVETDAEWKALQRLSCDFIQGWLVAKPMSQEDFMAWLAPPDQAGLPS